MTNRIPKGFSFLSEYALIGWIAFGCMVVVSFILVVWYFKSETERAKKALQTERYYISERESLLFGKRNSSTYEKYNHLSSEDEETCDEWHDELTRPVAEMNNSLIRILNARVKDKRYPGFAGRSPRDLNDKFSEALHFKVPKQSMDLSIMSSGSGSTQVSSRPLSYRAMRKKAFTSPAIISVAYAV